MTEQKETNEPEQIGGSGTANGAREPMAAIPLDWHRALAIAAHPDDLEYGMTPAIAEWTAAGKDVTYVLATRGEAGIDHIPPEECGPLREREQRASSAVVGVHQVEFLDYQDGVIEAGVPLRRELAAAIRRHQPELLLTINHRESFGDRAALNTPDHRAVGQAVLDAAGDAGNRWIFREQLTGPSGLEPWNGVRWVAVAATSKPTHAQVVGEASLERAIRSLMEHRAYLEGLGVAPAEYARKLVSEVTTLVARDFDGRPCVPFELFPS